MNFFADIALSALRPKATEPIWKWAERHVYLSKAMSPGNPGYYDSSLTPYTRLLQEFPLQDVYDELHVIKSSQGGFTEATLNIFRWMPENQPGPGFYGIDTEKEARRISSVRLKPTIDQCAGDVMEGKAEELGTLDIDLGSMNLVLAGGASSSPYRNKPIEFGVIDEAENHKINLHPGAEGTTVHMLRSRFTTVDGAKLIVLSKPKLRGGIIDVEAESGSMHRWFVPCPHCDKFQILEDINDSGDNGRQFPRHLKFGHLKDLAGEYDFSRFDDEVFWECVHCGCEIYWKEHQPELNAGGEWRRTHLTESEYNAIEEDQRVFYKIKTGFPRRMSMKISDMNSPFRNVCWGRLAQMFVNAVKGAEGSDLKHLYTNHLTIPWEADIVKVEDDGIKALRSGIIANGRQIGPRYSLETDHKVCPVKAVFVSVHIDRQETEEKFTVVAHDENQAMWLLDFGSIIGDQAILGLFEREYPLLDGIHYRHPIYGVDGVESVRPVVGLIDAGDRTFDTYDLTLAAQGMGIGLYASMGTTVKDGTIARRTREYGEGKKVVRYDHNDHKLKKLLYHHYFDPAKQRRLWLPTDIERFTEFTKELRGEELRKRKNHMGYALEEWKKVGTNDYGDTLKMGLVCSHNVREQMAEVLDAMRALDKAAKETAA